MYSAKRSVVSSQHFLGIPWNDPVQTTTSVDNDWRVRNQATGSARQ
jgi:hypothetical protein